MSMHEKIWLNFEHMIQQSDVPDLYLDKPFTTQAEFMRQCFHNHTPHNCSLKLTPLGHRILQNMYECWSIDLPEDWTWCAQTIIHLHKKIKCPYYWDRKRFYVYHSEIGLEFELVNRDWRAWVRWD